MKEKKNNICVVRNISQSTLGHVFLSIQPHVTDAETPASSQGHDTWKQWRGDTSGSKLLCSFYNIL